jgi:tetratricopeptide (TPR) repeat protein/DNA-binding CsgD family transcriptional regulator
LKSHQPFRRKVSEGTTVRKHDDQDHPWNVPFRRNPFFTGRDDLLNYLHDQLNNNHAAALTQSQALTGLGGIGKTQVAIEYAYRYREAYDVVFWVRAASRDSLVADFVVLASLLSLPGRDAQDQTIVVAAVKRWLADHQGWLLIMDNADDLSLAADFLPSGGRGHVLLTTRAQATGRIAPSIAVEKMQQDEGALLLLRRAKLLAPDAPFDTASPVARTQAEAIVRALDGLPLALDQAGAYIEEVACSLAEYLELYQQRWMDLLNRQSTVPSDYPHTVVGTWSLAFEQVDQANPAAADLLRLCAFLDPDIIPEAIFIDGASALGAALAPTASDVLLLNEAIGVLRRFSLVRRVPEAKLLNMHRLVQVVLRDRMDAQTQRLWAERAVYAVNATFPEVAFDTWARCELCLPQTQACVELIDQYQFTFPEAARLLHQAGCYLRERGLYRSAEPFLKRALAIREHVLDGEHLDTASTLDHLALLYMFQGQYGPAEALLQRALAIKEHILGPDHLNTAETLDNLARLYYLQGEYEPAEALIKRAVTIVEHVLGPEHPETAILLDSLAYFSRFQGKYEQAQALHQQALRIKEQTFGPEHPETAFALDSLASLYRLQGQYEQAKSLYQRALTIREQVLGPEHPYTASTLDNLALVSHAQHEFSEAEALHQRALAIREQVLGPNHPDTANSLTNLAWLYHVQGQYEQAEPLYQRALAICEQAQGPEHPDIATALNHLARLYQDQGQYEQAKSLYQRALVIREKKLGPEHPDTVAVLKSYTEFLRKVQPTTDVATPEGHKSPTSTGLVSTPSAKALATPAGLTAREAEVLRLVAMGSTSAQIAEQLTLSLLTVNTHVRSIYSKLGVTSRSAATRWAIEHQFV